MRVKITGARKETFWYAKLIGQIFDVTVNSASSAGMEGQLEKYAIMVYNPRRDDWDSSWEQTIDNPNFVEQVMWELTALKRSDYIIMYFDPDTKSPISLLELGIYAHSNKLIVVCPDGFWRKGNVDIVCREYGIRTAGDLVEAIAILKERLSL